MAKSNSIQRFRMNNFKGGMNTTAEDNALFTFDPNASLGIGFTQLKTELRNIQNFTPLNRGGLSKMSGFALYKAMGSGTITGMYRFIRSNGDNYFLISQGTKLYKLVTGTTTDLGATLSNGAYTHFETARDYCIVCDGSNSPLKFDGTSTTSLGGTPPAGARQALFYQNRLWMFSATNNTSLLYYSDPSSIESGYASNFVNCDINDGQKITAIAKFFIPGELTPVILVGKERSVGIVTGDGTTSNPYTFKKVSFDVGIPGFRQIVQFGQDAAFLTPQGVSSYDTSMSDVNLKQNFLSQAIADQFTSLNSTYLPIAHMWYDWRNNRVSLAMADGSNTTPNLIWHFDVRDGGWSKQAGFSLTSTLIDTDGTFYHGDENGNIYQHQSTLYNYNGSAIIGSLETPYLDFNDANAYKRIKWASITIRGNGICNLGISSKLNYGTQVGSAHTISLPNAGYYWNDSIWTNTPSTYQWGGVSLVTQKFYPKGIFQNIAFTFNQTGLNQSLDIFELNFEVEYLPIT